MPEELSSLLDSVHMWRIGTTAISSGRPQIKRCFFTAEIRSGQLPALQGHKATSTDSHSFLRRSRNRKMTKTPSRDVIESVHTQYSPNDSHRYPQSPCWSSRFAELNQRHDKHLGLPCRVMQGKKTRCAGQLGPKAHTRHLLRLSATNFVQN